MSAIAGFFYSDGRPDAQEALERMLQPLTALGPDRQALWHDATVALGARQMILVPEDRFDRQPWHGRDGTLVFVANGRIDNRGELARALGLAPRSACGMSDSEMLLRAYERWERACLAQIVGEFTFAAWDRRRRRLFCARSHLDGPPLYYHRGRNFFAFATTASALFALPEIPRAVNERRIACQLTLLPRQENDTFYRDISCLPAGHYLSSDMERATVERYWRLDITRRLRFPRDDDYVEAARERFDQAVAAHLRTIRGIGSHLSSGCDSSGITAAAAGLLGSEETKLVAFTAAPRNGYRGANSNWIDDESPFAATTAALFPNVSHVILRSSGSLNLDCYRRSELLYGRPIQNPSNQIWIEQILDAAKSRQIGALLSGSGGNMSISYDGLPHLATLWRTGHWLALGREVAALRGADLGRARILEKTLGPFVPLPLWRRWLRWRGREMDLVRYSPIDPSFASEIGIDDMARRCGWETSFRPPADGRALRRMAIEAMDGGDYRNAYLAGWGIEHRKPAMDRRVVEFCLAIPEDQYLRNGQTKFLYRRLFAPILPTAEIVARKPGNQAADWHEGLTAIRAEVTAELGRLEHSPLACRTLDLPRLRRQVEDWPHGGWNRLDVELNYRVALLRGIATGIFIRTVEGGNS